MLSSNEDAVFNCYKRGVFNIDLNSIDLDNNFDKNDPDIIIILIILLVWHIRCEKCKKIKIKKCLASHKWWDSCMLEDEKEKEVQCLFRSCKSCVGSIQNGGISTFLHLI